MATNAIAPQPSCLSGRWWLGPSPDSSVKSHPHHPAAAAAAVPSSHRRRADAPVADDIFDDKLLAREMNDLTVQDREAVYDEIHGVADTIQETPELLFESLASMREEREKIPKRRRLALDRALFLKPSLATDDDFHLMFLRAERFHPSKAAAKLVRHFSHKLELWGEERLVKRITLDDMGEAEMKHVRWGAVQTPVVNSRGDRALFFMAACNEDVSDWLADVRYKWYKLMELCEDQHAQKAGVVSILCFHGEWQHPVSQTIHVLAKAHHIFFDLPFRVLAQHLCYDQPALHSFLRMFHTLQGRELRLHTRTHFGSEQEVQYSLLSYNIALPPKPFTVGEGIHSAAYIQAYIDQRRRLEADYNAKLQELDGSPQKPFLFPRAHDVLMGRGWPFQSWHGNVRMANQVVAKYVDPYMTATKRANKTQIATTIVEEIQNAGNRFLERTDQGWVLVADLVAREKTSQILRAQARARTTEGNNKNRSDDADWSGSEQTSLGELILNEHERMDVDVQPKRIRIN